MNELPYELQQIETKLSRLVPRSDPARDAEVLRLWQALQPAVTPNASQELARAKRQSFWLGGILGLCIGAIVMFLTLAAFMEMPEGKPPKETVTPIPPASEILERPGMTLETIPMLHTTASVDTIRHLIPPPSAFWIPFSLAALSVVFVTLLSRHLRVRFVF